MRFIPTHCQRCGRSRLVEAAALAENRAACTECGGPARAIPGASYGREDIPLFEDLAAALAESGISHQVATELRARLDAALSISPGARLAVLCQALPTLPVLRLIARRELFTVRKAEGMLMALLAAIATTKLQSGTLAAVESPLDKARSRR